MAQRAPDVRHHLPFRDCIHLGNTRGNPSPYPPGLVLGGCVWDGIPALSSGVCQQCKGGWPTGPCIVNESWEPFSVGLGKGKFCSRNVFGEEGGQGGNESIVDDPKEVRRILMMMIIIMVMMTTMMMMTKMMMIWPLHSGGRVLGSSVNSGLPNSSYSPIPFFGKHVF